MTTRFLLSAETIYCLLMFNIFFLQKCGVQTIDKRFQISNGSIVPITNRTSIGSGDLINLSIAGSIDKNEKSFYHTDSLGNMTLFSLNETNHTLQIEPNRYPLRAMKGMNNWTRMGESWSLIEHLKSLYD